MSADADIVENHKHRIINQLETRVKFETSITSAQDLIRQSPPSSSIAAWKLKDEIKTCDTSIDNLKKAHSAVGTVDIAKLIEQVQLRKDQAKKCIAKQKDELNDICDLKISTQQDIAAIKNKLMEQMTIFKGSPDEEYINDMSKQLNILMGDMTAWGSVILSPEDTDRVLKEQIVKRCEEKS
jgi:hypothetical protein